MEVPIFYAVIITFNPDLKMLEDEYASIIKQVNGIIYVDNSSINKEEIKKWCTNRNKIEIK